MKEKKEIGHLIRHKMKLTTLSPVFIGGGYEADLNKTQYVFDDSKKIAYIINEKKLAEFLIKNNHFEEYLNFIKSGKQDLKEWLTKR
ncbi:MAG: hypothetical protein AB1782_18325, partial [Cyanobacteriota bacterium]